MQDCESAVWVQPGTSAPSTAYLTVPPPLLLCHHACLGHSLFPAGSVLLLFSPSTKHRAAAKPAAAGGVQIHHVLNTFRITDTRSP